MARHRRRSSDSGEADPRHRIGDRRGERPADGHDEGGRALARDLRPAGWPRPRARSNPACRGRARNATTAQETNVIEAYEAFSRGVLNSSAETFESLDRAVWLFERAIALDPSYARAHVELGAAYGDAGRLPLASRAARPCDRHAPSRDRAASGIRRARGASWARCRSSMGQEADGMASHPARARHRSGGCERIAARWVVRSSSDRRASTRPPSGSDARSSATRAPAGTPCNSRIAPPSSATSRRGKRPSSGR